MGSQQSFLSESLDLRCLEDVWRKCVGIGKEVAKGKEAVLFVDTVLAPHRSWLTVQRSQLHFSTWVLHALNILGDDEGQIELLRILDQYEELRERVKQLPLAVVGPALLMQTQEDQEEEAEDSLLEMSGFLSLGPEPVGEVVKSEEVSVAADAELITAFYLAATNGGGAISAQHVSVWDERVLLTLAPILAQRSGLVVDIFKGAISPALQLKFAQLSSCQCRMSPLLPHFDLGSVSIFVNMSTQLQTTGFVLAGCDVAHPGNA